MQTVSLLRKGLAVGIILLFACSSMSVLAKKQDKMPTPLAGQYSFAFIFGMIDSADRGLFHFAIYKYGFVTEFPLWFIGFDRVTHRFRFDALTMCTISGGLHIGTIGPYACCLLAHNVSLHG